MQKSLILYNANIMHIIMSCRSFKGSYNILHSQKSHCNPYLVTALISCNVLYFEFILFSSTLIYVGNKAINYLRNFSLNNANFMVRYVSINNKVLKMIFDKVSISLNDNYVYITE